MLEISCSTKFFEAKEQDPVRAENALRLIGALYMMEEFSRQKNHRPDGKLNNVEPFAWLKQILSVINDTIKSELYKLFPGNMEIK